MPTDEEIEAARMAIRLRSGGEMCANNYCVKIKPTASRPCYCEFYARAALEAAERVREKESDDADR